MSLSTARPTRDPLPAFVVYVLAVVIVSALGGLASATALGPDGWYRDATKPWFTPPGAAFGVVWTLLYASLAVVAWRLSRIRTGARGAARARAAAALRLWWFQLAVNLAWTPLFFTAQWLVVGLVDILVLDVLVALLVVRAWRLDRLSGALLVPYLAWALFASVLTLGFVLLN